MARRAPARKPAAPDATAFLRSMASHTPAPVYLLLGSETFFKGRVVTALRRKILGADAPASAVESYVGKRQAGEAPVEATGLIEDLRTGSLFANVRLVRVEEARAVIDKGGAALAQYCTSPPAGVHLVLEADTIDRRTTGGKALAAAAVTIDCRRPFDHPPPWQADASPWDHPLAAWVVLEARAHGLTCDKPVAHLLTQRVGGEPGLLAAECERLAAVLGGRVTAPTPLTHVDCDALVPDTRGEDLFRFGEALAQRDAPALHKILASLFRDGVSERSGSRTRDANAVAIRVLGWTHRTLRELWVARDLRRPDDIAQHLGKKPVFAEQLARQAARWRDVDLVAWWPRLRDADVACKSGAPARLTIESLLVELVPAPAAPAWRGRG